MVNVLCRNVIFNLYLVSELQSQVKILDVQFKVRQNELFEMISEGPTRRRYYATDLFPNLLPYDPGHLIAIQFHYRVLDCDFLRHGI